MNVVTAILGSMGRAMGFIDSYDRLYIFLDRKGYRAQSNPDIDPDMIVFKKGERTVYVNPDKNEASCIEPWGKVIEGGIKDIHRYVKRHPL